MVNDAVNLIYCKTIAGPFLLFVLELTVTVTAGSNPLWRVVCVYYQDGTIKCSTVKSGVFLYTLSAPLEGCLS